LLPSWQRHLRAANLSPRTITAYLSTGESLVRFLRAAGMPTAATRIRREHLETFIEAQLARFRPSTAATRYRDLKQLFRWLLDEGEIDRNPMERMRPPKLDERPVPVIPDNTIRQLLASCSGRSFEDRRDTAILFVLIDTGARLSEIADLRLDEDLDLELVFHRSSCSGCSRYNFVSASTGDFRTHRRIGLRSSHPTRLLGRVWAAPDP